MQNTGAIQSVKLMDGKLTLYQRRDCKVWWCGFYHQRTHVRTSTKTQDLKEAKEVARSWFIARQYEISNGVEPVSKSNGFSNAADRAIERYVAQAKRGERSDSYVKGLRNVIQRLKALAGRVAIEQAATQQFWDALLQKLMDTGVKAATIHQYKNALMVVLKLAYRRGDLSQIPRFLSDRTGKTFDTPRTYFDSQQYTKLFRHLRTNKAWHRKNKTRWIEAAEELPDYVLFVANSGLRVGEAMNVRFCDVEIRHEMHPTKKEPVPYLIIKNIKGKASKSGQCKTYYGAYKALMRCVERHGLGNNWQESREPIFRHYHRDMFRKVLEAAKLRETDDNPPLKRDLMSLRHTYICFRLEHGAQIADIAANCRTSVQMISKHYAKWRNISENKNINRTFALNED
jgi:integrase